MLVLPPSQYKSSQSFCSPTCITWKAQDCLRSNLKLFCSLPSMNSKFYFSFLEEEHLSGMSAFLSVVTSASEKPCLQFCFLIFMCVGFKSSLLPFQPCVLPAWITRCLYWASLSKPLTCEVLESSAPD